MRDEYRHDATIDTTLHAEHLLSEELEFVQLTCTELKSQLVVLNEELVATQEQKIADAAKLDSTETQISSMHLKLQEALLENDRFKLAALEAPDSKAENTGGMEGVEEVQELKDDLRKMARQLENAIDNAAEAETTVREKEKLLEQYRAEKADADANVEFESTERARWQEKAEEFETDLDTLKSAAAKPSPLSWRRDEQAAEEASLRREAEEFYARADLNGISKSLLTSPCCLSFACSSHPYVCFNC